MVEVIREILRLWGSCKNIDVLVVLDILRYRPAFLRHPLLPSRRWIHFDGVYAATLE